MQDFNSLIQAHFGKLTDQELTTIRSYFKEERLSKNDYFTRAGDVCKRLSLVKFGLLRVYAISEGREVTQWISTENYLVTEIMGFFFEQPNRWSIQALTDVELLTINKSDYLRLCQEFPKWNEIEKQFIVKCFKTLEDRVFTHLSMTTEQRYDLYFEQNKELFNQVPLQYIASVLGMTPETFSRIRKRRLENS